MSEENLDNHQSQNDAGNLEDENADSELDNSHAIRSDQRNDLEENNSIDDNEIQEDQEIEDPIEEIEDEYYSQNSSNARELSTSDDLSNEYNEDHFELNSTNYNTEESSNFITNDQSVNEIANKEDEIREQLDLNQNKPFLDGFFEFEEKRPKRSFETAWDHTLADYRTLLDIGIGGLLKKAEKSIEKHNNERHLDFLNAVTITLDSFSAFIDRYSQETEKKGEKEREGEGKRRRRCWTKVETEAGVETELRTEQGGTKVGWMSEQR